MSRARRSQIKAPLGGAKGHSRARVSRMTAQELMTLAQRHIRSLTAIIDRLNQIGAQDELRRISLDLTRLASLVSDATPRRSEKRDCPLVQPADNRPIDAVRPRNHALALARRQPRERFLSLIRAGDAVSPGEQRPRDWKGSLQL